MFNLIDTNWIWSETQIIIAADASAGDQFGVSAAITDNILAIGSYLDDTATGTDTGIVVQIMTVQDACVTDNRNAGSVYMYAPTSGNKWTQLQKIEASDGDASDSFGILVGVLNDTLVVGATGDDDQGSNAGIAAPPVI